MSPDVVLTYTDATFLVLVLLLIGYIIGRLTCGD